MSDNCDFHLPHGPTSGGLGTVLRAHIGTRRLEMVIGFREFKTPAQPPGFWKNNA